MPDTLDETGFDPEHNVIGEDAIAEWRERAIRVAAVVTGDTQVARIRPTILLMIAAAAVALAPIRVRVPGIIAILLAVADTARRR